MAVTGESPSIQGGELGQRNPAALHLAPEPGAIALDDLFVTAVLADYEELPQRVRRSIRTASPCSSLPSRAARRSGRSFMLATVAMPFISARPLLTASRLPNHQTGSSPLPRSPSSRPRNRRSCDRNAPRHGCASRRSVVEGDDLVVLLDQQAEQHRRRQCDRRPRSGHLPGPAPVPLDPLESPVWTLIRSSIWPVRLAASGGAGAVSWVARSRFRLPRLEQRSVGLDTRSRWRSGRRACRRSQHLRPPCGGTLRVLLRLRADRQRLARFPWDTLRRIFCGILS